jgi:hypothetical protein
MARASGRLQAGRVGHGLTGLHLANGGGVLGWRGVVGKDGICASISMTPIPTSSFLLLPTSSLPSVSHHELPSLAAAAGAHYNSGAQQEIRLLVRPQPVNPRPSSYCCSALRDCMLLFLCMPSYCSMPPTLPCCTEIHTLATICSPSDDLVAGVLGDGVTGEFKT